jgi:hypothetical protein
VLGTGVYPRQGPPLDRGNLSAVSPSGPGVFHASAELLSFARGVTASWTPDIKYLDFWTGFPHDDHQASLRVMFSALFGGLGIRKPIAIWTVFRHHRPQFNHARYWTDRFVHVAFSGEAHHLLPDSFDLSLIMAPDDPARGIVTYLNFAANAHEFGLWPLLRRRQAPPPERRFCVAVVSNRHCDVRNRFLTRLAGRGGFDSCGRWMNNAGFLAPFDVGAFGDRLYPFLAQYQFAISFENSRQSHYLTEKLANAYAAGTVPLYWGAPEAPAWLNRQAFLQLEDESDAGMEAFVDRVETLAADRRAYAATFEQPLLVGGIPSFMRLEVIREKIEAVLRRRRPDAFSLGGD